MTSPAASPSRTGHDSAVISAGAALDLSADIVDLTAALVDIPSVSRDEERIADLVEDALRAVPHLTVIRIGHTVVARTELGRPERVVIAGHLDTVPPAGNVGARIADGALAGIGSMRHEGRRGDRAEARRRTAPSRTATSPTCSTSARRSRRRPTA